MHSFRTLNLTTDEIRTLAAKRKNGQTNAAETKLPEGPSVKTRGHQDTELKMATR